MKRLVLLALVLAAIESSSPAQEVITLTTPEAVPTNTRYRLERLTADFDDPATLPDEGLLRLQFMGIERPISRSCTYTSATTPTGTVLNNGLNRANMASAYSGNATTGSLKQRIHHRLVVMGEAATVCDGALIGSLTGSVP